MNIGCGATGDLQESSEKHRGGSDEDTGEDSADGSNPVLYGVSQMLWLLRQHVTKPKSK